MTLPDSDIVWLDSVKSTNSYMSSEMAASAPHGAVVAARTQTAGRGQRGNSWEAEPGKNLTFSMLLRPEGVDAAEQFHISEAVALGVVDALRGEVPEPDAIKIKWPNDIYWTDKKICGILIENSLSGRAINHSIAGIGINVNQAQFVSDAPNPVSLLQITGQTVELEGFLHRVVDAILKRMSAPYEVLHDEYMRTLWGREGRVYRDVASGELFRAVISDVAPTGHITLLPTDGAGSPRVYAFKEVAVMI